MSLTPDDIRLIVREVVAEEKRIYNEQNDALVLKTVSAILTGFGLDEQDRREVREDFMHLRRWRKSVERVETVGWGTVITVIVGGLVGALWLGIKTMIGK